MNNVWSSSRACILKILLLQFMRVLRAHSTAAEWMSEDDPQESALSSYHGSPRVKLRLSGLAVGVFTF